jgi:hypothetical protein
MVHATLQRYRRQCELTSRSDTVQLLPAVAYLQELANVVKHAPPPQHSFNNRGEVIIHYHYITSFLCYICTAQALLLFST